MGQGLTQLRLIGVHDSGEHLLLSDGDGGRYVLPLDETLKAAARRDRPRLGQLQIEIDGAIRPREVQALVRMGLSPEEIADRTGWSVDRIRRYEGPVLAEREHAATLAQQVYVRAGSSPQSLGSRVARRLHDRGVDPTATMWDAIRSEEGNWMVNATFLAGGRERTGSWYFDIAGRTVVAANDEARWLSEDDTPGGPIPAPHSPHSSDASVTVFDVEADGGVSSPRRDLTQPVDLMQAMRDGSSVRSRRRRRRAPSPTDIPLDEADDALPVEKMRYDPQALDDPPDPDDSGRDDSGSDITGGDTAEQPDAMRDDTRTPLQDESEPEGSEHLTEPPADVTRTGTEPTGPAEQRRPKGKRPSVPTWDDIMFGTRPPP